VRVDRLDPAKNTLLGFEAYEHLLERRSDLCGRTRFLAFLVPSRESLPEYREYRHKVLETARRINERFAAPGGPEPVTLFLQNNVEAALAGLALADVVLINSLADGMNLVAKEMTMVGSDDAVLVLSRTAGVAEAYRDAAILVDPEDLEATADALAAALAMSPAERRERMARMRDAVTGWTLSDWLTAQLALLFRRQRLAPLEALRPAVSWPSLRA
jgi:trehalose 6-phosphate synthase